MCLTGFFFACILTSASGLPAAPEQAALNLELDDELAELAAQAQVRFPDADRGMLTHGQAPVRRNNFAMGPIMPMTCDGAGRHQMFGVVSNGQQASCEEGSYSLSLTIRNR
ncbi:MAG: hypothetical protein JJU06_21985 [Ectothiorhodospiraceae bacterium]|nr:hypothetical protein [Ectothiorhodospiraceae bacterium]MCH8506829.1 hypothetical protein [Ectothiorhodospiraceae bacterium]